METPRRDPFGRYMTYRWPMDHRWDRSQFDWGTWYRFHTYRAAGTFPARRLRWCLDRKGTKFFIGAPRIK